MSGPREVPQVGSRGIKDTQDLADRCANHPARESADYCLGSQQVTTSTGGVQTQCGQRWFTNRKAGSAWGGTDPRKKNGGCEERGGEDQRSSPTLDGFHTAQYTVGEHGS